MNPWTSEVTKMWGCMHIHSILYESLVISLLKHIMFPVAFVCLSVFLSACLSAC